MYKADLRFYPEQLRALEQREARAYSPIIVERNLIELFDTAGSISEAESIMTRYGLCDICNYSGLSLKSAVMLSKVVVKTAYRFPRIRSKFCFIGSRKGYRDVLISLRHENCFVRRKLGADAICTSTTLAGVAREAQELLDGMGYDENDTGNVLATAFGIYGILDALVVDEADFGAGYEKLCTNLRACELDGTVAKGCGRPAFTVFHECGHLLDFYCGLDKDEEFVKYYNSFSQGDIRKKVSDYAATSIREFIAEAFAEYMSSYAPRITAREVYSFMQKKYRSHTEFL